MLGLTTTSKLEEAREQKERAEDRAEKESTQRQRAERGASTLIDVLPELPEKSDEVMETEQPYVCYKAVREGIACLVIPEGATVVYPSHKTQFSDYTKAYKIRTSEARVVAIRQGQYGNGDMLRSGTSEHDWTFNYRQGHTVTPEGEVDRDTHKQCTDGIHVWRKHRDATKWYSIYC